jgi:hypothetical protein
VSWKGKIYKIIENAGGKPVSLQTIYSQIKENPICTANHMESWEKGGQPKYEC